MSLKMSHESNQGKSHTKKNFKGKRMSLIYRYENTPMQNTVF